MSFQPIDRMTAEDRAIYEQMPIIGRLMVHRDRRDARIMLAHEIDAVQCRQAGEYMSPMRYARGWGS